MDATMIAGKLIGRVATRVLLAFGLGLRAAGAGRDDRGDPAAHCLQKWIPRARPGSPDGARMMKAGARLRLVPATRPRPPEGRAGGPGALPPSAGALFVARPRSGEEEAGVPDIRL